MCACFVMTLGLLTAVACCVGCVSPVIDAILMLLVTEGIAVPDMDVVRASASTITNKPGSKPGGNITHIHKRGGDSTHKHKGGHQQQKHGNQKRKGSQKRQS